MQLPELQRQIAAGSVAAAAFLTMDFGLGLTPWVDIPLAIATYIGMQFVIGKKIDPLDIVVFADVTKGEQDAAVLACTTAATLLAQLSENPNFGSKLKAATKEHANQLSGISQCLADDPQDVLACRRFISHYLPRIISTYEEYTKLIERTQKIVARQDTLQSIEVRLMSFAQATQEILDRCLQNDFDRLSVESATLEAIFNNPDV